MNSDDQRFEQPTLPSMPPSWPSGPIPQPSPVVGRREEQPPPPVKRRGRSRILVPFMSAFLGAVLALAAVAGAGLFNEEDATTTTTVAEAEAPVVPAGSAGTATLQLREPNVDAVGVGEIVIPSIVTVEVGRATGNGFGRTASGSGVVLDADGHIVTNDHVVSGGTAYRVVFADGRMYAAELVGTDPLTDLAVLSISAEGLVPIELGSSDALSVGDPAIAVGSPLGLDGGPSLTVGVLSAFDRQVQTGVNDALFGMLQTDAPITQGSSGGALVDEEGRLIGITTAVGVSEIGVEGIGFATPVEIVQRVTAEIIETGEADTAFLGITGGTEFQEAADGAQIPAGVAVGEIEPGGAAAAAGLEVGDLITALDGHEIDTMQDLIVLLRRASVGDSVELTIERAGETSTVDVVLGAR